MRQTSRRSALALLGATALTSCATPQIVSRDTPDPFEGGIGGTGIVGLLTDFGSLIVNGLRIELTGQTQIFDTFGQVSESALAPGQSLTIYAIRDRDAIVARRVDINHALIGTLDGGANGPSVNGVPLEIEPNAPVRLTSGQRIAVSGLWATDRLIVSRIDAARDGPDVVAGTLVEVPAATTLQIGGAMLQGVPNGNRAGDYTIAFGTGNTSGIEVAQIKQGRFTGASDLRQLSVEGYLEPINPNPGYRVAGLGHSFGRNLRLAPLDGQRAVYFGSYDGLFQANLGFVLPQDYERRRSLLRMGYADGFDGQILRL